MSGILSLKPALRVTDVEVEPNGVCTVWLNRPARGNAYTARTADELDWLFRAADEDDSVKAVILGGRGKRFCVGADLTPDEDPEDDKDALSRSGRDLGGVASLSVHHCRKPTLVAIHGSAVGIGITLPLAFDLRICEADTKVGFVFAARGLSIEAAASYFLPRLVGVGKAMQLCLTARVFRASEEPTLFTEVVPPGQAMVRARALAQDMVTRVSLPSLIYVKRSIQAARSPHQAHELESRIISKCFTSPEVAEGFASFLEKRPAKFPGTGNDVDANLSTWAEWPQRYPPRRSKL